MHFTVKTFQKVQKGFKVKSMDKLKLLFKNSFTSITIMVVPHSTLKPVKVKASMIGLFTGLLLAIIGAGYLISVGVNTIEYYEMRKKLSYLSSQFNELKIVLSSLKKADKEFTRLLSFQSKKTILEEAEVTNDGALDIELLKKQVDEAIQSVTEIRKYLEEKKDLYRATPAGLPLVGPINSGFGLRKHPIYGNQRYHSGIDIGASVGTPIKATADGIVSFSSWHNDSGYIVVLEHGHGFSSVYAHNKLNYVKVGQKIRRGEVIGISGSTGTSTGPHLHYEVWKSGGPVNPASVLKDVS
jgi:murein DD-endopeptidase MepM/ murein hydrolase activator NlpD